jgi:hypothetical protein
MARCFVTLDEFAEAVGIVNADITRRKHTIKYATKYVQVAQRIRLLAVRIDAKPLYTITDDGVHIVSVKGFGSKTWTIK